MNSKDLKKFQNLSYDAFKKLALDPSLSRNEKIGFPEKYRNGKENHIYQDIQQKLPDLLNSRNKIVMDIGCGCGPLLDLIAFNAQKQQHQLILIDSYEMLSQLDDNIYGIKIEGVFPEIPEIKNQYHSKVDMIIVYSVFHYVFYHQNIYDFLDNAIELLAHGGQLLIGDIPNSSKKERFFKSEKGIKYHQEYTNTLTLPKLNEMQTEPQIDDQILIDIIKRYRSLGNEVFILPQNLDLPFANRREDLLIIKL